MGTECMNEWFSSTINEQHSIGNQLQKKEEEEEKTLNKYGLEIIYGIHVLIDSCSRCRYEQKIYFENDWAK